MSAPACTSVNCDMQHADWASLQEACAALLQMGGQASCKGVPASEAQHLLPNLCASCCEALALPPPLASTVQLHPVTVHSAGASATAHGRHVIADARAARQRVWNDRVPNRNCQAFGLCLHSRQRWKLHCLVVDLFHLERWPLSTFERHQRETRMD